MKLAAVLSRPPETRHLWTSIVAAIPLMLLLGAITPLSAAGDPLFAPAVPYQVGVGPESVAIGDFDGDGSPDLAVANNGTNSNYVGTVSVLLGTGDGTFGPKTDYGTPGYHRSVAVGDMNRDGELDLVTASSNPRTVSVLLGRKDGTFAPMITTGTDSPSHYFSSLVMALGDLNADGNLDVVIGDDFIDGSILVMLGNGDGTLGAPTLRSLLYPQDLAIGDLNRDGKLDLVVVGDGISVMLGNGDGTFGSAATTSLFQESEIWSVAIGDLNRDANPDLVVGSYNGGNVGVLLGNGDGTFQSVIASQTTGALAVYSVAIGDLDGDGRPDVAAGNTNSSISVMLGNGNGTLGPQTDYGTVGAPVSVAIGDFNRDGKPDLTVTNFGSYAGFLGQTVSVLLNIGPDPITVDLDFHPHTVYL